MNRKKAPEKELGLLEASLRDKLGEVTRVTDAPVREYMLKWLSAFAPDMSYSDAKAYCLPRFLYKNYLWHAFSFRKAEFIEGDEAIDAAKDGFPGECFILMNNENLLCTVPDGSILTPDTLAELCCAVVFTKDFKKTYVNTGSDDFGPYFAAAKE